MFEYDRLGQLTRPSTGPDRAGQTAVISGVVASLPSRAGTACLETPPANVVDRGFVVDLVPCRYPGSTV